MKSDHTNPPCGGVLHGAKDRTITGMSTLFAEKTAVPATDCVANYPLSGIRASRILVRPGFESTGEETPRRLTFECVIVPKDCIDRFDLVV